MSHAHSHSPALLTCPRQGLPSPSSPSSLVGTAGIKLAPLELEPPCSPAPEAVGELAAAPTPLCTARREQQPPRRIRQRLSQLLFPPLQTGQEYEEPEPSALQSQLYSDLGVKDYSPLTRRVLRERFPFTGCCRRSPAVTLIPHNCSRGTHPDAASSTAVPLGKKKLLVFS